ncbi:DUF3817 domain-containing protein [Wenzhouxiangella sp. XN79A]|uniref:DUF3817 domain-containing protein n=1 Tax=Wenzhouxiangella sp. XN79A TaxID=2724193 RepID=UPI00144AC037|nr:DUF3817 domain-containing protein [Wenzhouxiangella sp. XN79A]NKI36477.1 DUF3817 domain-containing protein [Wenzhouxiangella sp. XN79A]
MLKLFRIASLAEGVSLLVILSVTVGFISRDYVFVLGMTHGVLFMVYFVLTLLVSHRQGWSVLTWLATVAAGMIPFAFIGMDMFLKKEQQTSRAPA